MFKLLQSWHQVVDNGGLIGTILMDLLKVVDNEGLIGTILMDLSKVYDCIPHNLLTTKLECYGVDKANFRLLLDYLTRRR